MSTTLTPTCVLTCRVYGEASAAANPSSRKDSFDVYNHMPFLLCYSATEAKRCER